MSFKRKHCGKQTTCCAMEGIMLAIAATEEEKRMLRKRRRNLRNKSDVMNLSDEMFIKNFRIKKSAFLYILSEIEDEISPAIKSGLPAEIKLAACLRFFAEGNYQHGAGQDFNVAIAQSTFSNILSETLDVMERKLCAKWITLVMTEGEIQQAKLYFYTKSQIPGITMCVDGTHIKIVPPKDNTSFYYNRKGYYSLNALIMCDHQQRIRYIDPCYQGSNHDSHIWRLSSARQYLEQMHRLGDAVTILGDAGFPSEPWLLTPYRTPEEGSAESEFNRRHSVARAIIERTIGVLKNRFRCILGARQLHYSATKAAKILNVCCALHNICLEYDNND